MLKYLIYLRKSQLDKDFECSSLENTLQRHNDILCDFSKKQKMNVVKTYKEVVSGESLSARPQMQALLEDIQTGEYAGVLCMDIDRLSRGSSFDSGYIMQVLQINDCKIITPAKTYDLSNTQDEQFTDMKFMFSRYELKTITNRLVNGRKESTKEGKYVGAGVPYGYRKVKLKGIKGYTLEINSREAEIIKSIYELYTVDKMGYTTIYKHLNSIGVDITIDRIINILKNPIYVGKVFYSRTPTKKQFDNGRLIKTRFRSNDYQLYDGLHPSIIDQETFDNATAIRESRQNAPLKTANKLQNPFATLMYCKKCGAVISRNHASCKNRPNAKDTYKCLGKRTYGCDCVSIVCDVLEEAIVEKMREWLDGYIIEVKHDKAPDMSSYEESIKGIECEISKLKKQQDGLCELLETGVYSVKMFQDRTGAIQNKINTLESDLNGLLSISKQQELKYKASIGIIPKTQKLLDSYDTLDTEYKNELWIQLLERIEYYRSGDDVDIKLYPKVPKK